MKFTACDVVEPPLRDCRVPVAAARKIPVERVEKLPLRVLVVDDEALIRWSVTQALSDLGIEVEQAGDAVSTLAAMATAEAPFNVIVLDLRLPDVDDLSLLADVRRAQPDSAVVLMTAFGTPEIVAKAYRMGVRAVLSKPFELDELSRVVVDAGHPRSLISRSRFPQTIP